MSSDSKKMLWLVNKHAVPLQFYASHTRTVALAEQFMQLGYEVRIIGASTVHNKDLDLISDDTPYLEKEWNGVKFIHIKCCHYKGNSFRRIMSFYQFARRVYKFSDQFPRPDYIIHTSNIPFDTKIYDCARKYGAKYILDILDIWPDAFASYGLLKRDSLPMKAMYAIEKRMYAKADHVVFAAEGGRQYIKEHGWDREHGGPINMGKVHYINNGVDLGKFDFEKEKYRLDDDDLNASAMKKMVYIGSIRLVNDLHLLIDAAAHLLDDKRIVFLIYGDGPDRNVLETRCKEQGITNVIFKQKWVEPQYVPYIMCHATVNLMNYKKKEGGNYGYSQNKLFQALASGRPICCNRGGAYSPIIQFGAGVDRCFVDEEEYARNLKQFADMPESEYDEMCRAARMAALNFDYARLAQNYLQFVKND